MFPYEQEVFERRPKKKGVRYGYEDTKLEYTITRTYNPDFTIYLPSNLRRYVEVKGYFRPQDKMKMRAVKNSNPGVDIRFVFPSHNEKNEKWCHKHGFPFAIGGIPKEWLV